ncbi:MAG: uroporphyrinogen-III C-methyltransferase [Planctomycetes bacterium]|nr:uroporphyrinogen-III C-methyltransferase [Planctomycetota bacterium]
MIAQQLQREQTPGTVYLIGAGPGDPELITVRGLKMLRAADVVVHDRLVPHELLAEARQDTEVIDVGKYPGRPRPSQEQINRLIIERARGGAIVARLKGGDPCMFGRGGEELMACRRAGVRCVVIPGVSSILAVPAAAGVPVTHRGMVRSMAVVTGQADPAGHGHPIPYRALAEIDTVVVLMGLANLDEITARLIEAGRAADTPAISIASGCTAQQRVVRGHLGTIAEQAVAAELGSPVLTLIGEVADLAPSSIDAESMAQFLHSNGDLWATKSSAAGGNGEGTARHWRD